VQDNRTSTNGGGAFASTSFTATESVFINNTANSGGAVYHLNGTGQVTNTLFARNRAGNAGNGLYLTSAGAVTILNSTIASPTQTSGNAIYIGNGTVNITNTIIASHTVGIDRQGGTARENYNLFFGNTTNLNGAITSGGNSQFCASPAFVNPTADDYHLSDRSGAIDVGLTVLSLTVDYEGEARPQGGGYDIGFDESPYTPTPLADLTLGNSSPTLLGFTTSLTSTSSAGSGICYQWNFGDNSPILNTGAAVVNHTYATLGVYTAVLTATDTTSNSFSATTVITIVEAPIVNLNALASTPTRLGNPTLFTATVDSGSSIVYTWNFGDGTTGSGALTSHTYPIVGTYTATITATNSLGTVTDTVTVLVEQAIVGLTATSSSPTPLSATTVFTATVAAGNNITFFWQFGDGDLGSGANPTHTYALPGVYTATVTAVNLVSNATANTTVTVVQSQFKLYLPLIRR
jgi:PKD repeat protein